MSDQNPWVVENIEVFSFYCCPECDFKSKNQDYFKKHAMESHNKSKAFFIISKPENTANIDPLEVEVESESQDENEKGMEDFDGSDTEVKEESISESDLNKGLETLYENENAEFFEDNLNTIDDQEAEVNLKELETFDIENYKNITEAEKSDTEEKNNIIKEKKKWKMNSIVEREKKREKMRAILGMEDTEKQNPVEIENQKIQDRLGNDPGNNPDFVAKSGFDFNQTSNKECINIKIAKSMQRSKFQKSYVNTPEYARNYLTLEENLEMRAILEKEDTEEEGLVEIENQKVQDCLVNDSGRDLDFIAKFGSNSATDEESGEESDQVLNKKLKKITKSTPSSNIRVNAKNYLPLEEKLEIIKLREKGVSSCEIARHKNMAESSVRAIYSLREKLKFQATLANPSKKGTRSMDKMESLLTLWVKDLDQRGILVGARQIQSKAKSLYLHAKENFEDKTEAEIKETFLASKGWFYNYIKRHDIKVEKVTWSRKAKSAATTSDLKENIRTVHEKKKEQKCEMCHCKFTIKDALTNHIKTVHEEERSFSQKQNLNAHIKEVNMEIKAFKCKYCNKSFSTKKYMHSHEKRIHWVTEPSQRYTCNECERSFSNKQNLNNHNNEVHMKIKAFKCKYCSKKFSRKHAMEKHEKHVHWGNQKYRCNECKEPFEKKQQMELHINSVHLNEKPYKCNICQEPFFIAVQLKQHLKKTHRICGKKLSLFE